MAKTSVKLPWKIIKADERHRSDVDRLLRETKIADDFGGRLRNCWVAKLDGRVVGCAALDFISDRAAVFMHHAVEDGLRKQGIGTSLINRTFEVARARGIEVLALSTMYYRFNFYKAHGFRTTPRAQLPDDIRSYPQFTAKRYMKCAVMINEHF